MDVVCSATMATHISIHISKMGITLETSSAAIEFGYCLRCRGLVAGPGPANPVGMHGGTEADGVGVRMPGRARFEGGVAVGGDGGAGTSRRRVPPGGRSADAASSSEGE